MIPDNKYKIKQPLTEHEIERILYEASINEPPEYWEWATDQEGFEHIQRTIKKYGSVPKE